MSDQLADEDRSAQRRHLDVVLIVLVGAVVSIAPVVWTRLAWSGAAVAGLGGWLFVFAFCIAPFVLLAVIRFNKDALSRPAAALAGVVVSAFVVIAQIVGLDPTDTSSTQSVILGVLPVYAAAAIGLIVGGDHLAQNAAGRWRSRAEPNVGPES